MPLSTDPHPCGHNECDEDTFYYKIVWIPYPEGIRATPHRGSRGKEGRLYLCPSHYSMAEKGGSYTLVDVSLKIAGTDDF